MRQIANAAGVVQGALYNHYETKQHLPMALMRGHMNELLAAWQQEGDQTASATERLSRFVHFHIGYHLSRPDEVFLSSMELRSLEPDIYEEVERLRRTYEACLKEILEQGVHKACFTLNDVHVIAMAFLAMLKGVNNWFKQFGRLSADIIAEHYVSLTLSSIHAQADMTPSKTHPSAPSLPLTIERR